jgi:hypothetical protein
VYRIFGQYPVEHKHRLICHPQTPGNGAHSVEVSLLRVNDSLEVTYTIAGLERVRVPEPRRPRPADRLWEHTCCEMFVRLRGVSAYHELNFSPSSEWAAYAFEHYREGAQAANVVLDPEVSVRYVPGALELSARVGLERLSPAYANAKLAIALAAVIEEDDGTLSYWALAHPPGKPDFHHSDAFALELDEIRN